MRVGDIPRGELERALGDEGLHLVTGAFTTHLRIELSHLVDEFAQMYTDYPVDDPPGIDDFEIRLASPSLLRRFIRPQALAWVDGMDLMEPMRLEHAYPMLESSLNLAVATGNYMPLVVHSAVLERDGRALVMPAPSGSGKSTLCAALSWRGWRLMSDEMALFCEETGGLRANPRPVSLKNRSVEVIAAREPRARFSRLYEGTTKGNVAYMQAPPEAVAQAQEVAYPGLVVAPMFRPGAEAVVRPMERSAAFRWLVDNSINYSSMLQAGFDLMTDFIERCELYSLTYSNLDEAIDLIDRLHRELPTPAVS
jgi:HprK-related kinase A